MIMASGCELNSSLAYHTARERDLIVSSFEQRNRNQRLNRESEEESSLRHSNRNGQKTERKRESTSDIEQKLEQ
jgi:hypothetical protein